MTTCESTTTVDGETIDCEHEAGHEGDHHGHIPEQGEPGLMWELVSWRN